MSASGVGASPSSEHVEKSNWNRHIKNACRTNQHVSAGRARGQPALRQASPCNRGLTPILYSSSKTVISGALPVKPNSFQRFATCCYIALSSLVRLEKDLMNL